MPHQQDRSNAADTATPHSTAVQKQPYAGQRIALVGGASRLGKAVALTLAELGADIAVAGRNQHTLDEVAARAPGRTTTYTVDISDTDSIRRFGDSVGALDHLVYTVSMHATGRLFDLTDTDIERSVDAKVLGPLRIVRATLPSIAPRGSFTFFSGQAAWRPTPGGIVTATVNGALAVAVKAMALELAPIRVNAIAPGVVDSGALDSLGDRKAQILSEVAERNPVGRVGNPEDIVPAVLMLLSNTYITGSVLHVDGGGSLR
nr:SDR family oxidoreductase [Rhodococcus sp. (in: high G+C Gram-positive bacteria)]